MTSTASRTFNAKTAAFFGMALASIFCAIAATPAFAQYGEKIGNDPGECRAGQGPAMKVTVTGISASKGTLRVQSYRATEADWLAKGRWISRIEVPARAGSMTFCLPLPAAGSYAVAVRHDVNNNGTTDLRTDGGGMSNNPSINIFNLGKPSFRKTAVAVGHDVKPIGIAMKYM